MNELKDKQASWVIKLSILGLALSVPLILLGLGYGFTRGDETFSVRDMSAYGIYDNHSFFDVGMDEALALRKEEDFNGILVFAFPECPWCQQAIPVIHEASQLTSTNVYYVSRTQSLRDADGWAEWDLEMAEWLDERIEMRWLYHDEEETIPYRPNIFVPQVIHLRGGEVISDHRGTFEGHDQIGEGEGRHLPDLTEEERNTLLNLYLEMFQRVQTCPSLLNPESNEGSCS